MFGNALGDFAFATLENEESFVLMRAESVLSVTFQTTFYVATQEFATLPTDAVANQAFQGVLDQPFVFRRSIVSDTIGRYTVGDGLMEINNTDTFFDFWLQQYAIDGRAIIVKVGRKDDPYATFFTVFSGTAADWIIDETGVHITLRDNSYKLTVPAQPNIYTGLGGTSGGSDLTGKRKPRAFGYVLNISPPLVDPAQLTYQVNDGQIQQVQAVYDRGIPLGTSPDITNDYATYSALVAAAVGAGNYATCLAEGYIKLGSTPSGTVTADLLGDKTGGTFVSTTGTIIRRILQNTSLVDPTDLYTTSFDNLEISQPSPVGYYLGPEETQTVADVIANMMNGIGGWGGFRRDGTFELRIFSAPSGTPVVSYDRTDIFDIKRETLPSGLTPPPYRQRVAYQRAWTVQTDLAGGVTATRRAFVAEPYRLAESSDATIKIDHPFAKDPDPVQSFFRDLANAQTEAARRLALYSTRAALYRMRLPLTTLLLDLGDVIQITYPRWDLSFGKLMTIVEINENVAAGAFEVIAYG